MNRKIKNIFNLTKILFKNSFQNPYIIDSKTNKINKKSIYVWLVLIVMIGVSYLSFELVNELVKQNVDGIMNDLHAMDDEFKAKIKAENDKRFGRDNVQKSWCYFDKNGNLYFRKSAFSK